VPYFKLFVPGVLLILSVAAIFELMFHAREAGVGDTTMNLFGFIVDSHAWTPLLIAVGVAVACWFVIARMVPGLKEAWDQANHVDTPAFEPNQREAAE